MAGKTANHSERRWNLAGPFDDPLRKQHQRRERAHPSRSTAGSGRRGGRADQMRPAYPVSEGNSNEQPAAVDVGQSFGAHGTVRRQHWRSAISKRSLIPLLTRGATGMAAEVRRIGRRKRLPHVVAQGFACTWSRRSRRLIGFFDCHVSAGMSHVLRAPLLSLAALAATGFAADLRLIDAIKNQNRKAVGALLSEHVNVNTAQPDGATPLAWAVYLDQADTVDLLMSAGAKVNTADEYGETPLTLACANGNGEVIRKLLEAGAD